MAIALIILGISLLILGFLEWLCEDEFYDDPMRIRHELNNLKGTHAYCKFLERRANDWNSHYKK